MQVNASARGIYLKQDFEEREVVVIPCDLKYTEHADESMYCTRLKAWE